MNILTKFYMRCLRRRELEPSFGREFSHISITGRCKDGGTHTTFLDADASLKKWSAALEDHSNWELERVWEKITSGDFDSFNDDQLRLLEKLRRVLRRRGVFVEFPINMAIRVRQLYLEPQPSI